MRKELYRALHYLIISDLNANFWSLRRHMDVCIAYLLMTIQAVKSCNKYNHFLSISYHCYISNDIKIRFYLPV